MKTKHVRPVLVESKESTLHLSHGKLLITSIESIGKSDLYKSMPQELILISLEDEEINIGEVGLDLRDNTLFEVKRILTNHYESGILSFQKSYCKKVIARQSQIPQEYISKFIEQYNNGCVEDFEIEVGIRSNAALGYKEYVYLEHICDKKYVPIKIDANINQNSYSLGEIEEFEDWEIEIYTKLTNGFVTIVEKEPITYTEEEVKSLCSGAYSLGLSSLKSEIPDLEEMMELDNWFENNKKK